MSFFDILCLKIFGTCFLLFFVCAFIVMLSEEFSWKSVDKVLEILVPAIMFIGIGSLVVSLFHILWFGAF